MINYNYSCILNITRPIGRDFMPYLTMDDGIRLYYENHGEGDALVFCHGLNSSHAANKRLYGEFHDDFNVVLYDQRGHGLSDRSTIHMNIKRLGRDLNEIIETLDLDDVTLIGHSMGAATIYSYVDQFGCDKIKRIVASDMSPYMRNDGWSGGIAQGNWSDEDFMDDLDRIFDDVAYASFYIFRNIMVPDSSNVPGMDDKDYIRSFGEGVDATTMASLWYSLFRSDHRPALDRITVPFMYLMPDFPLYSMEAVNYIKEHVKDAFILEDDFPGTTHALWNQMPHEVAEAIKKFIREY